MASVLVPLAEGCEELEAVTIIDLLRRAGMYVTTASLKGSDVRCSRGVVLVADTTLDSVVDKEFDLIVLPGGGPGAENLNADERIHALLRRHAGEGRLMAAICAAPKVLAKAGVLDGKRATAFPGTLRGHSGGAILSSREVEIDGNIVTSRGPGTAMDFSLALIELMAGSEARREVEAPLQRPGLG